MTLVCREIYHVNFSRNTAYFMNTICRTIRNGCHLVTEITRRHWSILFVHTVSDNVGYKRRGFSDSALVYRGRHKFEVCATCISIEYSTVSVSFV